MTQVSGFTRAQQQRGIPTSKKILHRPYSVYSTITSLLTIILFFSFLICFCRLFFIIISYLICYCKSFYQIIGPCLLLLCSPEAKYRNHVLVSVPFPLNKKANRGNGFFVTVPTQRKRGQPKGKPLFVGAGNVRRFKNS